MTIIRYGLRATMCALMLTTAGIAGASAQESARDRARRTLPSTVFEGVDALATQLDGDGVPPEALFNKALEGMAKRVPPDRLLPAVGAYAERLGASRRAFGTEAPVPLVVAGADALQRGVPADALRSLPRDGPRSPVAVLVLAELLEAGVPTDRALETLRQAVALRTQDARMLDIPVRVRRLIRDGVPPQEAMDRIRRQLRRDRGGRVGPLLPPSDRITDERRLRLPGG